VDDRWGLQDEMEDYGGDVKEKCGMGEGVEDG
jgi:hypothetical protein